MTNVVNQLNVIILEAPAPGTAAPAASGQQQHQILQKMSEASKEMELRANRTKPLLAEHHASIHTNQAAHHQRKLQLEQQMTEAGFTNEENKARR